MRSKGRGWVRHVVFLFAITILAAGCPRRAEPGASGEPGGAGGGSGAAAVGEQPARPEKVDPLEVIAWKGEFGEGWKKVDKLVDEQKYEQAAKLLEDMLEKAESSGKSEKWVRTLVRTVQLRMALHGYETAVRFLKEQPWPKDLLGVTTLHLYYAASLVNYVGAYSWEIRQRERVESKGPVDLKAWTVDQIYAEATRAFAEVFAHREQLGEHPVQHLDEHLSPNNYPRGIRGTLRDAVSYMWVELLADTSGWRPEHTNQVYQLDLERLLAGKKAKRVDLTDPAVHPLLKIVYILDDLERWHADRGEQEAALEARLTRLGVLHTNFTDDQDRARIRAQLRSRLAEVRKLAWWAQGMATLAGFVRAESAPDNLVRARTIALEGHKAYPESIGGQRCLHIARSIEMPDFQMQAMAADAPDKRSIAVRHKNLDTLHLRAYRMDLKAHIEQADDYNLFPAHRTLERIVRKRKPDARWEAKLPATPDYKMHRTFVTPPMKRPGYYLVVASARKDFKKSNNRIHGVHMVVSDLVLSSRQEHGGVEVDVLSGASGELVAGAKVFLYRYDYRRKHKAVDTEVTGESGHVSFERSDRKNYFLFARKGQQIAIDPNYLYLYKQRDPAASFATLIYTDRSIYRPQQTIHFKAVAYRGRPDQADYRTAPQTRLTISLMDANHQEVAKKTVTTNTYGTASGEFTIPAGRLLGQWQLLSSRSGASTIRVEEYKRPTFEAKLLDPEKALRLNRQAVLKGEARYYFGLPVTAGKVTWRVTRAAVYPWWWGYYWWHSAPGSSRTQTIDAGTAELAEDGTFTLRFVPEADERLADTKGMSFRYTVSAEVTDEGGETRKASRAFRLGFVAVEARLEMETNFLLDDQSATLEMVRTDLDGVPQPGEGSYRIVALEQPATTRLPADLPMPEPPGLDPKDRGFATPGDRMRPRFNPRYQPQGVMRTWPDGKQHAAGTLTHDDQGKAVVEVPALPAGAYRLHYTTKDAFGAVYEMSKELVVAGKSARMSLPGLVMVERNSVPVGGTARIFVTSGLDDQPFILDFFRGGRSTERRVLLPGRDAGLIEIPVTEEQRGGFGLTAVAVRDHQFMSFHQTVFVPWDNKELEVSFSTFRDKLRPGAEETWTVKVTGPGGEDTPVRAAELLAYMYDRSLDAFANHNPPAPLSLFPSRTGIAWPRVNLGQARTAWLQSHGFTPPPSYPSLQGDSLDLYSGYAIGGVGRRSYYRRGRHRLSLQAGPILGAKRESRGDSGLLKLEESRSESKNMPASAPLEEASEADDEAAAIDDLSRDGTVQAPGRVEIRTDFSETAFWEPHLLTGENGSVSFSFTVPDSVTSWNVWVHAITRDLKSGSSRKEARSVKELMVRPYLPRFLREGDRATIKVVVNNASEEEMEGTLSFDIVDPETEKSLLADFGLARDEASGRRFTVEAGGGTSLRFGIEAPPRVGLVAFRVVATSGSFSDGELRPVPLLPGRMHLAQSRFVTLRDEARREMHFADMQEDDPTRIHEQLVVTVDGQLFYAVLSALPYLVNYPYECTEQTLNRFVSTGILASMYEDYPAIERMAKKFARRETQYETWDAADPNRKMMLVETPWLQMARGGPEREHPLINVLDPRITRAQRDASLAKLRKAQTSAGGFPWFPGGPPSPYMTLYILYGFSKALEFGVDVARPMIQRAWRYMHRHYIAELVENMMTRDCCCWEFITFLNYVLSNYPDASWTGGVFSELERKKMLDFSFGHWKQHAPMLKGQLALTLHRADRDEDARLVWESVMDAARTRQDQGTFWAPEDRAWLWYNDTIETHAFAIRTLMELKPESDKLDGLVLWIFLNKKLNHWKSTRATAEVVYSLAHYLKKTARLGVREEIEVTAGDLHKTFVFEPDEYTGKKNQVVVPGDEVDPARHATVVVEKQTRGYALASATWHFSTEKLPAEARGDFLHVTRKYFKRVKSGREIELVPLAEGARVEVGDEVEVQLDVRTKHPMEYVHLRDPRPAGFEPVSLTSRHKWRLGVCWYEEIRDSGTNFFFENLPQGEYPFKYRLRAAIAGIFKASPATLQPMYAPEFTGYSSGRTVEIGAGD